MSQIKKFLIKFSVFAAIGAASLFLVQKNVETGPSSQTKAYVYNAKSNLNSTAKAINLPKSDPNGWNLAHMQKRLTKWQRQAKPMRRSMIDAAQPVIRPVERAIARLETRISLFGLVFIVVIGLVLLTLITTLMRSDDYA